MRCATLWRILWQRPYRSSTLKAKFGVGPVVEDGFYYDGRYTNGSDYC